MIDIISCCLLQIMIRLKLINLLTRSSDVSDVHTDCIEIYFIAYRSHRLGVFLYQQLTMHVNVHIV